jgi:hypothetical protein
MLGAHCRSAINCIARVYSISELRESTAQMFLNGALHNCIAKEHCRIGLSKDFAEVQCKYVLRGLLQKGHSQVHC